MQNRFRSKFVKCVSFFWHFVISAAILNILHTSGNALKLHSSYIWLKVYKNAPSVVHLITWVMDVCTLWPAFFLLRVPSSHLAQRAIFTPTPEMVTHWQDDTRNVCQIIMRVVPLLSALLPSLTVPEGVCLMCPFPTQRHIRHKEGGWYLGFNAKTLYNAANACSTT